MRSLTLTTCSGLVPQVTWGLDEGGVDGLFPIEPHIGVGGQGSPIAQSFIPVVAPGAELPALQIFIGGLVVDPIPQAMAPTAPCVQV